MVTLCNNVSSLESGRMARIAHITAAVATAGVLAVAPSLPASAADCKTVTEGYSQQTVQVCGTKINKPPTIVLGTKVKHSTTLPFTGGEITLMSIAGLGLVGGGTMLLVAGKRRRRPLPTA